MELDTGQEIYNQDGVLLRKASRDHSAEFNTTGCLYILEFPLKKYAIEWRLNDGYLISSTDTQEPGEWYLVDTIAKRNRTTSECLIFDTATNNVSIKCSDPSQQTKAATPPTATTTAPAATKRNRNIRVTLNDLKRVEVQRNGQVVRLITTEGNVHSEFLFQHGNADNLVRCLLGFHLVVRGSNDKGRTNYDVTADGARETQEMLRKTFAELDIDEIRSPSGWISNMVSRCRRKRCAMNGI